MMAQERGFRDCERVTFSGHAIRRMFEREIGVAEVRAALRSGEVVEAYPDDVPLPSFLLLAWAGSRPLHLVVAAEDTSRTCHVITAYVPDPERWGPDYRTRRAR